MKKKPLFFIILGILHLLEPFSKVAYFKLSTDFPFSTIMNNVFSMGDPLKLIEFWFLFPLAGIALLTVKPWSYPLFYFVQAYSFYSHLTYKSYTWPYLSKTPFWSSLTLLMINFGLMAYFLLPHIRKPFMDKGIRWWETSMRFFLGIEAYIEGKDGSRADVMLENLSLTGCLLIADLDEKFQEGTLHFDLLGNSYAFGVRKIRDTEIDGVGGIGYMFELSKEDEKILGKLAKGLKLLGKEQPLRRVEKSMHHVA